MHFFTWTRAAFLLTLLSSPLFGQEWKGTYDQAIAQYQAQDYGQALVNAHKAYTLSAQLEPRNQAYSLQLVTVICLESGKADEGLKWIADEELLFQKVEGPASKPYAEALRKHALMLQQKGSNKEAEAICKKALDATSKSQGNNSLAYASLNSLHGQLMVLNGNLPQAKEVLDQSQAQLASFPDAGEEYLSTLLLSAGIDQRTGDVARAEKKYERLIAVLSQNNLQSTPEYASAKSALAAISLSRGDTQKSESNLKDGSSGPEQKAAEYLKIAVAYQNKGDRKGAIENYRLAEQTSAEASLKNNTAFSIHLNYGRLLLEQKKIEATFRELTLAQGLAQKLYAPQSPEHALLEFAWGDLNLEQGNIRNALAAYQRAEAAAAGMDKSIRLRLLNNAARGLLNQNHGEEVVSLLKPIVDDKTLTAKEKTETNLIYCDGLIQSNQADASIAALSAFAAAAAPADKTSYEMKLAEALEQKGDWKKALTLLSSLNPQAQPVEHRAQIYFQEARVLQQLGNFTEAEKKYRDAIEAYKHEGPGRHDDLLPVYNSLGVLYSQLGNYDKSEQLYLKLIDEQKSETGTFHITVMENLASVYEETLRYDQAKVIMEKIVDEERIQVGEHHPDYAGSLQNLATLYQRMGNQEKAKALLIQALDIDKAVFGDNNISYATKAANLGVVYQQLRDFPLAQTWLEKALKIRGEKLGKDHPDYIFNEYNLAVLHQQQKLLDKAYPLFKHVTSFYIEQIHELFPAMSEVEKAAFYNKISEVISGYQDFAVEFAARQKDIVGDLYNFRLATKALLLNASSKIRNSILASNDNELLQHFSEWLQAKEDLGKLISLSAEQKALNSNRIQVLQQRTNDLEKYLSEKSKLFAEGNHDAVRWEDVKAALKPGEAAMEIIRLRLNLKNDSIVYAFLTLQPGAAGPVLTLFPNGRNMEGREFRYYRNSVKYLTGNERSYGVYWKPLENTFQNVKTIYLSPDGVYNKISLMTLYNPEKKQELVDQYVIRLVTNTRELLKAPRARSSHPVATLFGNPDFKLGAKPSTAVTDTEETDRSFNPLLKAIAGNGIPDLPGTMEEVDKVGELLRKHQWETSIFTGKDASEKALKAHLNTRILHIATHGFFVQPYDDGPVVLSHNLAESENNPLLRSGLIMSGAEKYFLASSRVSSGEDGILTAYEALNLNLEPTELVILSACETGMGEIHNGEGVYGLQRSFQLAGARYLMMSLWKVDDLATQELMIEFYNQMLMTPDMIQAFHNAQLSMRKKFRDPYYWGSFVITGHN